jgi:hypothetical protein
LIPGFYWAEVYECFHRKVNLHRPLQHTFSFQDNFGALISINLSKRLNA